MDSILNQATDSASPSKTKPSIRFAGFGVVVMFLYVATAFGTAQNTVVFDGKFSEVIEQVSSPVPDQIAPATSIHAREVIIQRGDNLTSLLGRTGIDDEEAFEFLRNEKKAQVLSRQLVPGKTFSAQVTHGGSLESLTFHLNGEGTNALVVQRAPDGFAASTKALEVTARISLRSATIQHSLFGAADEAGIPDGVAAQLADIFGGDIDFHRDLRKGDKFSVIYETASHLGRQVGTQRILAAEFINDGRHYRAFWYEPDNANGGYYTDAGRSVWKAFLRSPLEFSRVTSGFSSARYHPVLRETRAHRGIDYAAPTGTRVKSTGSGVVAFVGSQGGYGKAIMIRHSGNRMTVYGHLSGFASGIRSGSRVSQGEVIGFVGATGLATGPHLHYEFRVDGVHRNPLTIALPDAAPLPTNQLATFKTIIADMSRQIETIRDLRIALLD